MGDGWGDKNNSFLKNTNMLMKERFQNHPDEVGRMNTEELRKAFVVADLMQAGKIRAVYSHYDRMVIGGVVPSKKEIVLQIYSQLKAEYFLQHREMGIINIGGEGIVKANGIEYTLNKLDCLYVGMGTKDVSFMSRNDTQPANFYFLSSGAHHTYENVSMKKAEAVIESLGNATACNQRVIYKYIHEKGIKSCQLVMGLTALKEGNVWNTMPAHTHNVGWKSIFIMTLMKAKGCFILWVSHNRRDTWYWVLTKQLFLHHGPFMRVVAHQPTHLSGGWLEKINHLLIGILLRLRIYCKTNSGLFKIKIDVILKSIIEKNG
jgi:4-deoxy-L-threo-5-hexosulose-uronate ketol-isomerase